MEPGAGASPTSDGPEDSATVTITADAGYAATSITFALDVVNVPPAVTLGGLAAVDEAGSATYSWTVSDPGAETFALGVVDCGAGTVVGSAVIDSATGSGSVTCTFPDGPATTEVSVAISDGSATTTAISAVTVNNVAPTVTLSGAATVDEGDTVEYNFTTSDPGAETFVLTDESCGTGSTLDASTFDTSTGSGSVTCTFPDGPATPAVSVTVADGDGASDADAINVTVANVAPTVTLSGAATANEGDSVTYNFTTSDPGAEMYTVSGESCGTGGTLDASTFATATGSGTLTCTFPNGPATSAVSVTVADGDGASDADVINVTVANVAPTVTLAGAAMANEGDSFTYDFTTSDPGAETFVLTDESCGTGSTLDASTFDTSTGSGSVTCTFPDGPATPTVSVTVADGDGASDADAINVTVANVAPTVTLSGAATANEGDSVTYNFTTSDPGAEMYTVSGESCGTGGTLDASTFATATGSGTLTCTFPNGPATPAVSVTVADGDGASDADVINVTVANVTPEIVAIVAPGDPVNIGLQPVTVSVTTADPGADQLEVTWDWGDDTSSEQTVLPGVVTDTHTYGAAGVYDVTVTVEDDGVIAVSYVHQYIVIYDPGAGFVTGGGWIQSPAGACPHDPACENDDGRANFGFVSRYKKDAELPSGNTNFFLRDSNFKFETLAYDWLIVDDAGSFAQYHGTGTVNDQLAPNLQPYRFTITLTDGATDTFRIRIWWTAASGEQQFVYDNGPNQAINGGNIRIHTSKAR